MSENNFLVWMHSNKVKNGFVLGSLAGFPANAVYTQHPDFPLDTVLTDSVINSDGLIVASARLKTFLAAAALPAVEYLPVSIADLKGRVISREYFIVNPTQPVDGLDPEASGARFSRISKSMVSNVKTLVIKPERIPADRKLIRLSNFLKPTLIRRDLADDLDKTDFTGFRWLELSKFPEI